MRQTCGKRRNVPVQPIERFGSVQQLQRPASLFDGRLPPAGGGQSLGSEQGGKNKARIGAERPAEVFSRRFGDLEFSVGLRRGQSGRHAESAVERGGRRSGGQVLDQRGVGRIRVVQRLPRPGKETVLRIPDGAACDASLQLRPFGLNGCLNPLPAQRAAAFPNAIAGGVGQFPAALFVGKVFLQQRLKVILREVYALATVAQAVGRTIIGLSYDERPGRRRFEGETAVVARTMRAKSDARPSQQRTVSHGIVAAMDRHAPALAQSRQAGQPTEPSPLSGRMQAARH